MKPLKTRTSPQLLCAALLLAGSALAQAQNIKPGLWEVKMQPQLSPERQAMLAKAQQQLAQMPTEQRQMMEEMMAKSGVKANMASGEVTLKVCITPEQAALNQLPESNPGNCKHQLERKGAQILNRFSCIEPELSGEGTTTLSSPEAYRSTMSTVSRAGGKSETISVQSQGRWLSGDCGGIAPMKTSK